MSGKDELSFVPPAILNRVDYWTKIFKELKLTANLPDPVVKAFRQHPNAASKSLGYCHMGGEGRSGGYIAFDAEQDGEMLDQTVVEELCHWYSGATDATRGMQEFMLRVIVGVGGGTLPEVGEWWQRLRAGLCHLSKNMGSLSLGSKAP